MSSRDGRPFRFVAAWCSHPDYPAIVRSTWNKDKDDVVEDLGNVTKESIKFNKEIFGNIFANKGKLEAHLQGIQRALETVDIVSLVILQKELQAEYEKVLFQEESLWYQKSHEQWIKLGNRNTQLFHTQTVVRRKRNKIDGLHISSGAWCTDPTILQEEAVKFFQDLFCTKEVLAHGCHPTNITPLG